MTETSQNLTHHNHKHLPELDGLRALAVLLVLGRHLPLTYPNGPLLPGGFLGVSVFFVLSGFLITKLLLTEFSLTRKISLRNFYIRRALRLFPALYTMLAIIGIISAFFFAPEVQAKMWRAVLATVFYYANWICADPPDGFLFLGHVWSLSIEEQFYFLYPPLLFLCLRHLTTRELVKVVLLLILSSVFCLAYRASNAAYYYGPYTSTDGRAQELLVGCLLAVLQFNGLKRSAGVVAQCFLMGIYIAFVMLASVEDRSLFNLGFLAHSGLVALIILFSQCNGPIRSILSNLYLRRIGKISYPLYLWHLPIFALFTYLLDILPWTVANLLAVIATFVIATFSYRIIEIPFLRLKLKYAVKVKDVAKPLSKEVSHQ